VREALRAFLEGRGYGPVTEAGDGIAACHAARESRPDVALLDVRMPGLNGIDAAREIRASCPDTRSIALSAHDDEALVLAALEAGVSGYVLKSQAASQLVDAIEKVRAGEVYLGPAPSRVLLEAYRQGRRAPEDPLTPRERQVLQLLAEGRTTKEIADLLGTSAKTVESHRMRIKKRLNVGTSAGLVRWALRHHLIEA
jgi:two-component system response regulator NreC